MAIASSAQVHPTAVIDPAAEIGEDVKVGPFVVIDGPCLVGPGCVLKTGAHLIGPLILGEGNAVHSYAVLGDDPQHLRFSGESGSVEIGDHNVFREHVTVHRPATKGGFTRIGHRNYLMAASHVAHDCVVGNNCVLANASVLAGHCSLGDHVVMSGHSAVHQFCRVGRLAMISGVSASSVDLPPFMINQRINVICGVNVIGMRRAGISALAIEAVRKAFHILYLHENVVSHSLAQLDRELGHVPEVAELITFIRSSKRGITLNTDRNAA
ncbi:MAG: acyl-ACP--UDP-N-acetylglucosamine O-acyltransferase [Gemmataceae bacterium]